MTTYFCPTCRKLFEPLFDPERFHTDPPQMCSPECREDRKRRKAKLAEQDRLIRAGKAWCPGCKEPIGPVNYSDPLQCARCGAGLGVFGGDSYGLILWEKPT